MAKDGKGISAGILLAGATVGLGVALYFATRAKAAPPVYTCPYCSATFSSESALLIHIETEHPTEPPPAKEYTCPYCGAKFSKFEEMTAHVQANHVGERIPIDIIWE